MKKKILLIALAITIATAFIPVNQVKKIPIRREGPLGIAVPGGCSHEGYSGYGLPLTFLVQECQCICRDFLDSGELPRVTGTYVVVFMVNYVFYLSIVSVLVFAVSKIRHKS